MEESTYAIMAEVERSHWWYCGRRHILDRVVTEQLRSRPVRGLTLDLGCGTGANHPVVERCGPALGCDVSAHALALARQRGYARVVQADGTQLPFRDAAFHWVFATDIIEHLDDRRACSEIRRVLRPGGRAIITVPAFPSLWGAHDEASHHLRRYTRPSLLDVVRKAGLNVLYESFINTTLFLPIYAARAAMRLLRIEVASENTLHPGWANPILKRIFEAESLVVPRSRLPFGVSLLCIAERPAASASRAA